MATLFILLCFEMMVLSESQPENDGLIPFETEYIDENWSKSIIHCDDSNVIEIETVFQFCDGNNIPVIDKQVNTLKRLCNAHKNCNISDTDTYAALRSSCPNGNHRLSLYYSCKTEDQLTRMCSGKKTVETQIDLYSPIVNVSSAGQYMECKCQIVKVSGALQISVINVHLLSSYGNLTVTVDEENGTYETFTLSKQYETDSRLVDSNYDNGNASLVLLFDRNLQGGEFHLFITGDGLFTLYCGDIIQHVLGSFKPTDSFSSAPEGVTLTTLKAQGESESVHGSITTSGETLNYVTKTTELMEQATTTYFSSTSSVNIIATALSPMTEIELSTHKAYSDSTRALVDQSVSAIDHYKSHSTKKNETDLIAGIAGGVAFLCLVFILIICYKCKRRKNRSVKKHSDGKRVNLHDSELQNLSNGDSVTATLAQPPFSEANSHEPGAVHIGSSNHVIADIPQAICESNRENNTAPDGIGELYGSNMSVMDNSDTHGSNQKEDCHHNTEIPSKSEGKSFYDEALPVSHNADIYKTTVQPEQPKQADPPYFLYDDSHKRPPPQESTNTDSSGSSSETVIHPKILDYAASYMKTKGSSITTLKPLGVKNKQPDFPDSNQTLQAYSYADTRGRFIEGVTPHIRGEGYDIEKPVAQTAEDNKYEPFQSTNDKNQTNHTGSVTNIGPYSYADCGGIRPKPGSKKDIKPVNNNSNEHYESMGAINKAQSLEAKGDISTSEPTPEYEGFAFAQNIKKPVVVNGVELIENEVYSKE